MIKNHLLQKTFIALFAIFLCAATLFAKVVPGGIAAEGMLVVQPREFNKETQKVEVGNEESGLFFTTLAPESSGIGSVKTFSVEVVKKLNKSDWNEVKENNGQNFRETNKCLIRPVLGRVSSLFGRRRHPTRRSWHFHAGIDIVARKGTPVKVAMAGKVTFAGWKRGYGLVLVVKHSEEFETVYAHCSRLMVKKGQVVNTGQKVAKVGNTGITTGSHLHFEVRRSGNVRNPFRYMRN
ncbi:MAG: M23 family metallopeptidase [Candidatus Rifleibacteriota bacterium]